MSQGKVYEMLWDCQFCGTQKNLGLTHRFCPSCGAPQDPASRYYPSDADKIEVQDHVYVGVDVTCPSCSQLNSAAAEFCGQCGGPLTEGARAKTLEAQTRAANATFDTTGSRDVIQERFQAEQVRVGNMADPNAGGSSKSNFGLWAGIIALVVIVIGGAIWAFTWTESQSLIVTGHEWERTIDVESYSQFSIRSWRDSPPPGDSVSMSPGSCRQEQRSTRQIPDGQTCTTSRQDMGDGTFREVENCTTNYRSEPVYDDMCTWSGFHWQSDRTERANGTFANTPSWPNVSLNCEGQRRLGCERISDREEHYWVLLRDDESKDHRCDFEQSVWQDAPVESVWVGEVRVLVGGIVCDSLQRQ